MEAFAEWGMNQEANIQVWRSGVDRDITNPAQTAAIMQSSKSYYHCNGTDGVRAEEIAVWEGET